MAAQKAPMNARFEDIWVYLSATPLLGLTITLIDERETAGDDAEVGP